MKIKTVFISDIHLGTISCKSEQLLQFLRILEQNTPKNIFLVGDIIDLWKLRRGFTWKPDHNTVIQKLLRFSRKGVKVIYVTGNHDDYFRTLPGMKFGDIEVVDRYDYTTATDKKFLIIHGDQFDIFLNDNRILCLIGSLAYDTLVVLNNWLSRLRKWLNLPYWSLSQYLKRKAKSATNVIEIFEIKMVDTIHKEGYDGVVCGHIHTADIKHCFDNFMYLNCGDWTESCTAIIEYEDGKISLVKLSENNTLEPIKTVEIENI
jgi:UDP-2,3-diacylglucosamine pyrophosphatase LpxH